MYVSWVLWLVLSRLPLPTVYGYCFYWTCYWYCYCYLRLSSLHLYRLRLAEAWGCACTNWALRDCTCLCRLRRCKLRLQDLLHETSKIRGKLSVQDDNKTITKTIAIRYPCQLASWGFVHLETCGHFGTAIVDCRWVVRCCKPPRARPVPHTCHKW